MRKIILFISILSCISIGAQSKYVAVKNIKELEKKLAETSAKTNTISSLFTQEKHLAFIDDTITSKGRFWFQKENKLRWEYTSPFKYIIVINNGKFIIKDDEKKSEYDIDSNKAFQEVNKLIVSSVRGTLLEEKKFSIKAYKNSKTYLVKLQPKDPKMKGIIQEIALYFSTKDHTIYKVIIKENKEDFTIITFKNRKINEAIPASTFIL